MTPATLRRSVGAVGVLLTVLLCVFPSNSASGLPRSGATAFGTLVTSGTTATVEARAGLRDAMMELDWSKYEPKPGVFDATYASQAKTWLRQLKAAGLAVTLGLGLHYTPAWILAQPDSRYVNEDGASSKDANLVFNQALRDQAALYIARVASDLGLNNFAGIRLTAGGNAEMLYPSGGSYWAFDVSAQNNGRMPATMKPNPFPGWRPGTLGLSPQQVGKWLSWYVNGLDDVASWQMKTFDSLGFRGRFQLVTPGSGVRPDSVPYLEEHNLPTGVAGVGAVWHEFYAGLPNASRVEVYVSSVADGSGRNDSCSAADRTTPLTSSLADSWSSTRWLSRIADQFGMAKGGENPGYVAGSSEAHYYQDPSATGMMAGAVRQAASCGFTDFYWAHDDTVGRGAPTLTSYASNIKVARLSATRAPAVRR